NQRPIYGGGALRSARCNPLNLTSQSAMPDTSSWTIAFNKTRLSWTTSTGIHGDWRIIAAAKRGARGRETSEPYFLAPMVLAGDVFGDGRLPLDPPYSYQVTAASDRHVILRDAAFGEARRDSDAPNAPTFSTLHVHAPRHRAMPIDLSTLAVEQVHALWPLSARI